MASEPSAFRAPARSVLSIKIMTEDHPDKSKYANTCGSCGQIFDLSILYCPQDGNRLTRELVGASSLEILKITGSGVAEAQRESAGADQSIYLDVTERLDRSQAEERDADYERTIQLGAGSSTSSRSLSSSRTSSRQQASPSDLELPPGTILDDKYEIMEMIGRGGMSMVYLARHEVLQTQVAIKTLLPHLALNPMSLQRFHQEARAASNLNHANVIQVHDFGTTPDGLPYLVMDYVDGLSLGDLLHEEQCLKPERALNIFIQVADALQHAHGKGIVHRDLKPSNILLVEKEGRKDNVKIVDFGIAKLLPQEGADSISLTQTGEVFGSPLYMSPEQCKGEKLDSRADIYSMGCLMYETLSGKHVFEGGNTMEVLYKQINDVPRSLSDTGVNVSQRLERIVFKSLAKDPAQRYQSMAQLKRELEACLDSERFSVFAPLLRRWELFWLKRKPRTAMEKMALVAAVVGLTAATVFGAQIGFIYWNAANSPARQTELVFEADRAPLPPVVAEDPGATMNALVHYRQEKKMMASHESPATIRRFVESAVNTLVEQKQYHLAARLLSLAAQYSINVNGEQSMESISIQKNLAECLMLGRDYNAATGALKSLLRMMSFLGHADRCPYLLELGKAYYLQEKWEDSARSYAEYFLFLFKARHDEAEDDQGRRSPDEALAVSRMALCHKRLADKAERSGLLNESLKCRALSSGEFKEAYERWLLVKGTVNNDAAVALANYVHEAHLLKKNRDLDGEYEKVLHDIPILFGDDSAYYAVTLSNHSDYLLDRGSFTTALSERLRAWKIFSALRSAR